ncbi:MAG: HdeD family acid-resistance protein [Planctomycetes bacterium]|nr:HdeD family acid-resistance protein [Planctomycetota bacterium]
MLDVICRRWWVMLVRGLAAIAIGVCAMAWPGITLMALVWLFGAFSIIDGVFGVMLGIRGESDGTVWWTMVFLGLLALAAGVIAFAWPGLTLLVLATIIAVSAIVRGVFEIYAAIRLRHEIDDEWILGLSGLMSIIFGGLIMWRPGAGLVAIALLIGAYMTALGIFAVALSLRLRKMGQSRGAMAA